ncbi:response regulator transcription factor [Dethiobacter alkaliphilus]|uniref:Two component transcriptional regulator, LuxR family n=1 Tax=Dethiobacter alkaliphilus AHT 1 TaxID=555088 RepID=C0GHZ2_DETAL|nr:response regulator transcription factor [Dethiobacter alkaliphilus]EEG77066.1 two component transcriptional regulator, LuxR family [Dethiobacter alkaliphilus AHT 1]
MKVLIVDDDALIRDGLKVLLEMEEGFEVSGVAANGREAYERCVENKPDIVLMDVRMPVMDGVLGTKLIKEHYQDIKVVILTTFKDDEYIAEAARNGAEGYLLKNQSLDSIVDSLRVVGEGNTVFQKEVAGTLHAILKGEKKKDPASFQLTKREFEVLKLVGEGLSNDEIAQKLFLTPGTVRNYISNLLVKLNLRDRTQLAIFFHKNF